MAITKEISTDQITICDNKTILFRVATRIIEDGNKLSETYHRGSVSPGDDISNCPKEVQDVCNFAWKDNV